MSRGAVGIEQFPFASNDLVAVVTTRLGGVSTGAYESLNLADHVGDDHDAVLENRRRLCDAIGVDRLTVADQQHGSTVVVIDAALAGRGHNGDADARAALPATDALVTDLPGVALGVLVGDCAPVVVYDAAHRAVGVAHCGRRGVISGVLPKTIATMASAFGSTVSDLAVGVGPHISAASYEIGSVEADAAEAAFPGAGLVVPTRPGHATFDLLGALRRQLEAAGVRAGRVSAMHVDTRATTDRFFSDRAERPCGRFMAVMSLR